MRPIDVKSSTYIDFGVKNNEKDPKFNVRDQVRISRNKNNFAKGYIPNWWEQVIVIKNVKNTVLVKKGDKLYVKWKSFDNSFNSWIDKKDVII